MRKAWMFAAVVLLVGTLGGCTKSDDANSCADACKKLGDCWGLSSSEMSACTSECKQELAVDKSTQDIIDCIVKNSCSALNNGACQ